MGSGDEVSRNWCKMWNFCAISNVFLYKIMDLMNIIAGLGEYILQTHNTKKFEDSMGGLNPLIPLWVRQFFCVLSPIYNYYSGYLFRCCHRSEGEAYHSTCRELACSGRGKTATVNWLTLMGVAFTGVSACVCLCMSLCRSLCLHVRSIIQGCPKSQPLPNLEQVVGY